MTEKLWTPGESLDDKYPILTSEELREQWTNYLRVSDAIGTNAVLGAYSSDLKNIETIVSVDLDEVIRDTHGNIAKISGKTHQDIEHIGQYSKILGVDKGGEVEITMALMNQTKISPVDDYFKIALIMQKWRNKGVAIIANTSTLPGCEKVTVDFLDHNFPGAFDGIVFPRNHDGTGPMTKAKALESVIEQTNSSESINHIIHIDDAPHHVEQMIVHHDKFPNRTFSGLIPLYVGYDAYPSEATLGSNPLECFEIADRLLDI